MAARRICLVTSGYLSANPRLLKEAQALSARGDQVTVIANGQDPVQAARDELLLGGFKLIRAAGPSPIGYRLRRLLQLLAVRFAWLRSDAFDAFGISPITPALAKAAKRTPADLYIGHNLAALPAVAQAAHKARVPFAFDVEDLHVDELTDTPANAAERARRRRIEARYLPRAAYVSAAAPLFVEALKQHYGIQAQVISNAFPRSMAALEFQSVDDGSLYWVSQQIGPRRGIEEMLEIIALTRSKPTLRLRGSRDEAFCATLTARATELGVQLDYLPTAAPEEMARLACASALGLAIEVNDGLNRELCLTNKLYFYLLAGLPILLSNTRAQAAFAAEIGDAGLLIDLRSAPASAAVIDAFLTDSKRVSAARECAWRLGQTRFNFEAETPKLYALVDHALRTGP